MKEVLVIFLITLIHGNDGGIYVEGPSEPVAEGTEVTLQCMSTDPGTDLSQVHLRQLWGKDHWYVVDEGRHGVGYIRLLGNQLNFTMESAWTGTYACVSNNDISPDNSSQPLTLGLQFLLTPNILRRGSPDRALSDPSGESWVTVREGEDVVMDCHSNSSGTPEYYWSRRDDDWIVPSSTLYLRKMQAAEEGQYTCMAQLPGDSLSRSHKVYISVRPEISACCGPMMLTAGAAATAVLLLGLILGLGVVLGRHARRAARAKGPIDDHCQKKPIFKGSAESLPASISGDTQPLV